MYVTLPDNVPGNTQPPKKLVGWAKIEVTPQSIERATVTIPQKYLSTWDIDADQWVLNPGTYRFTIADTSNISQSNNVLTTSIELH